MLARVATLPHVTTIVSPYGPAGASQLSGDHTIAFASVTFDELAQSVPDNEATALVATAKSADAANIQVAVSGQVAQKSNRPGLGGGGLGIVAAAVVLFLVFGSLLAMALPLISTLVSLGYRHLAHRAAEPRAQDAPVLVAAGPAHRAGVGVDYALFIVTRHRQGLLAGRDVESSLTTALRHVGPRGALRRHHRLHRPAGHVRPGGQLPERPGRGGEHRRAVHHGRLAHPAAGAARVHGSARVLSRRQRAALAADGGVGDGDRTAWARWSARLERAPLVPAMAAVAVIVLLALPFFSLRLGASDQGNDPTHDHDPSGLRPAGDGLRSRLQRPPPADHRRARTRRRRPRSRRMVAAVGSQPDVARVGHPALVPAPGGGEVALVNAYPRSAPQDAATADLIQHLRSNVIPPAIAGSAPGGVRGRQYGDLLRLQPRASGPSSPSSSA